MRGQLNAPSHVPSSVHGSLPGAGRQLSKHEAALCLFSHGNTESNRKIAEPYDLKCPILLVDTTKANEDAFQNFDTPAAYVLDKHGRFR